MNCPYCSAEMSSGYIKSPREIVWDTSPKVKLLPAASCRKILIDL